MKRTTSVVPVALAAALAAGFNSQALADEHKGQTNEKKEAPKSEAYEKGKGAGSDVKESPTAGEHQKQDDKQYKPQHGGASDVGQQPSQTQEDKGPMETVKDILKDKQVTGGEIVDSVTQARREVWINTHLSAMNALKDDFKSVRDRINEMSGPTKGDMMKDLDALQARHQEVISRLQQLDKADTSKNFDQIQSDLNRQVDQVEKDLDQFKNRVNAAYHEQQGK